jgi:hypothetical protein
MAQMRRVDARSRKTQPTVRYACANIGSYRHFQFVYSAGLCTARFFHRRIDIGIVASESRCRFQLRFSLSSTWTEQGHVWRLAIQR